MLFAKSTGTGLRAPLLLTLLFVASVTLTSGCASLGLSARAKEVALNQADPPQRVMPQTAKSPCEVYVIQGTRPSDRDVEIGYHVRGAQIATCEARRELAVQVHEGEHKDELAWKKARVKRSCPWWRFGTCRAN